MGMTWSVGALWQLLEETWDGSSGMIDRGVGRRG